MDGPFMLPGTGPIPGSPGGPAAGAGGFTYPDISSKSYIDRRR